MRSSKPVLGVFYSHNPTRISSLEMASYLRSEFNIVIISNIDAPFLSGYCDDFLVANFSDVPSVIDKIVDFNRTTKFNGLITLSEAAVTLLAYCCEAIHLVGNSVKAAKLSRNKYEMRCLVKTLNVRQPKFFKASSIDDALKIYTEEFNDDGCFIKPPSIGGSSFCTKIKSEKELCELWEYFYTSSQNRASKDAAYQESFHNSAYYMLLEERLSGTFFDYDEIVGSNFPSLEVSVEGFINGQTTYVYSITDKPLPEVVVYGEEYLWRMHSRLPQVFKEKLVELVNIINRGMGAVAGCSHTEFRVDMATEDESDIYYDNQYFKISLIETALRIGGANMQSAIYQSTGFNSIRAMANQACGREANESVLFRNPCIMFNLWAEEKGFVTKIDGLDVALSNCFIKRINIYDGLNKIATVPPEANRALGDILIIDKRIDLTQMTDWECKSGENSPYRDIEKSFIYLTNNIQIHTKKS